MTKDAALADDLQDPLVGSPATNPFGFQNIGRFVPCSLTTAVSNTTPPIPSGGDYVNPYIGAGATTGYRYHFALCLFEYFSAQQNPNEDYTPNVTTDMDWIHTSDSSTNNAYPGIGLLGSLPPIPPGNTDLSQSGGTNATSPVPVPNSNGITDRSVGGLDSGTAGTANLRSNLAGYNPQSYFDAETTVGSDGLINVNTASWKVLACVPLVPFMNSDNLNNSGQTDWKNTETLAKKIVYFRDIDDGSVPGSKHPHGPFRTLWELNLVPGFATFCLPGYAFQATPPTAMVNASCGDYFSDPARSSTALPLRPYPLMGNMSNAYRALNDWEYTSLMVNRVSNLLTVRSDTFTAYLQVQAWQNVGTPRAQMVAQRRAAYIFDRSSTSGLNTAAMELMQSQSTTGQIWAPMSTNPTLKVFSVPTN